MQNKLIYCVRKSLAEQTFLLYRFARRFFAPFLLSQKKFAFCKFALAVKYCARKSLQANFLACIITLKGYVVNTL